VKKPTTPHTQTQQDVNPDQSDIDSKAAAHEEAHTGTDRGFSKMTNRERKDVSKPPARAFEGSISSRTSSGPGQGISSRPQAEEKERQDRVVKDRPDAKAGVNHSG